MLDDGSRMAWCGQDRLAGARYPYHRAHPLAQVGRVTACCLPLLSICASLQIHLSLNRLRRIRKIDNSQADEIIHQNGFSREELLTYRMTVYWNLVDSAQAIVLAMRKIAVDCETPSNHVS